MPASSVSSTPASLSADDHALLARVNALRRTPNSPALASLEQEVELRYGSARHFAVYGTLGPGRPNHHRMADVPGNWREGFSVNGKLVKEGWGAAMGYPALHWSRDGPKQPIQLLISDLLPSHWTRLDEFEGEGYVRILAPVTDGKDLLVANIYVSASSPVRSKVPGPGSNLQHDLDAGQVL